MLRSREHRVGVALERAAAIDLGAAADEAEPGEKHRPDNVGRAISPQDQRRATVGERGFERVEVAERGSFALGEERRDGLGVEGSDPAGEDFGASAIELGEIRMLVGEGAESPLDRRELPRDGRARERVPLDEPAEGELLDREAVVPIDPGAGVLSSAACPLGASA